MTSVKFKRHLLVKGRLDMTIQDVFTAMAEYAGIHQYTFTGDFSDPFSDATAWDIAGAEGTWGAASEQMSGVGTSGWQFCATDTYETPKAFVLDANVTGDYGAIAVLVTDLDNLVYCWWNTTNVGITQRSSDSDTVLCSVPKTHVDDQDIRISVQPALSASDCFVSMWSNEQFMANAHLDSYPSGRLLGLGCYGANTMYCTNITVPELCEVLEYVTMDVGESPGNALKRAIGRRHINYFVRWDGSLKVWRPQAVASSETLTNTDLDSLSEIIDRRGLVSHWRQVGAWDVSDAWDTDLLTKIGHRFHKDDNPDLLTEDDCEREAGYSLARTKQYAHQLVTAGPYLPLLEPEDRVTINGEDWLISGVQFALAAGALLAQVSFRGYGYA
jgi:hypothetical protein